MLLQTFLCRVVNGDGKLEREYAAGRKGIDLVVRWPRKEGWPAEGERKYVIECKVVHERKGVGGTAERGLKQIGDYMELYGAEAGHLVVYDLREGKSWEARIFKGEESAGERPVAVWGM